MEEKNSIIHFHFAAFSSAAAKATSIFAEEEQTLFVALYSLIFHRPMTNSQSSPTTNIMHR